MVFYLLIYEGSQFRLKSTFVLKMILVSRKFFSRQHTTKEQTWTTHNLQFRHSYYIADKVWALADSGQLEPIFNTC